jgi:hypothetical protein
VQIAEHQGNFRVPVEALQRLAAGLARDTTVTAAFEELAKLFDNQGLIVDHEHLHL